MAISFKTSENYGYEIASLFGVPQHLINQAKACDVVIEQSTAGKFVIKRKSVVYGSVSIAGQAITLAKAGTLGPASKGSAQAQFSSSLQAAIAAAKHDGAAESVGAWTSKPEAASPVSTPAAGWPAKNPVTAKSPQVKLSQATELYQPVNGTSPGSTYYTFCLLQGAAIAVRFKGDSMSIRVEGPSLTEYGKKLSDAELDYSSQGHYSAHFEVSSQSLAVRTLGAILAHVGIGKIVKSAEPTSFVSKYMA